MTVGYIMRESSEASNDGLYLQVDIRAVHQDIDDCRTTHDIAQVTVRRGSILSLREQITGVWQLVVSKLNEGQAMTAFQ